MEKLKIKSITKLKNHESKRYDIETDRHNFFANNILVHNCGLRLLTKNGEMMFESSYSGVTTFDGIPMKEAGKFLYDNYSFTNYYFSRTNCFAY